MKKRNNLSWTILAGGEAKRMGGSDKGLINLNGKPLIEHVLDVLTPQIATISISANRNIEIYQKYAPVISDEREGFQGPLAGIERGIMNSESEWVGFVPCDSPNISDDLVSRLSSKLDPEVDIYVASDANKLQPVFSVWNKKVLPKLTNYLENGDRKIMLFFKSCNTVSVDFSDIPEIFANLNSKEDLIKFGNNHD
ncbi:molybdenum cofactor guanylyltransferase MobA [Vibrio sp. HN007]|uniref:molybdenum cofactor guanylyltransferase MobA n=1 Tax=Vibrio iocasae TaxID=3098914 RepID=UPI0035D46D27